MKSIYLTTTAFVALLLCAPPDAHGGLVSWSIDASQSQLRMAIPDQSIMIDGTTAMVRMRNQTGSTTSWTVGNVAAVAGTLLTDYVDGPSPSIEFLPSTVGQTVGVNSGNYRPDLNTYTGGTVNPDGSATGGVFTNTTAPAVYGGRLRATISLITSDGGFVSFNELSYSATSGEVAVNPLSDQFPMNQIGFGILGGLIGVDYVLPVVEIPDAIYAVQPTSSISVTSLQGVISTPDPVNQPLLRQLQLPIFSVLTFQFAGGSLQATMTGNIVATAIVPEPGSSVLLALGVASLAIAARLRRRPKV